MEFARTAYFEGNLSDAEKQEFYEYMVAEVLPIIQSFPGQKSLQVNYPETIDPAGPQKLLLMLQHTYADEAAMSAALMSDRRTASMHATNKIIDKLNISVFHINFKRESF